MNRKKHKNSARNEGLNPAPWIAGALFVLGLAVLAGIYLNRNVKVERVVYRGLHFVDQAVMKQNVQVPTGISPDSLNFMTIIETAELIPYVRKASVNVEPGGNLEIRVEERKPIALLSDGTQKAYIDSEGVILSVVPGKAVDVPIVYGFSLGRSTDTLTTPAWNKVQDFLMQLKTHPFYDATISELAWTAKEGIVAMSHENGVKLIFGNEDYDTKLRNWKAFYKEVIREKGIDRMRTVDLRFEGQIVTREQ